jgi:hypothetical protein
MFKVTAADFTNQSVGGWKFAFFISLLLKTYIHAVTFLKQVLMIILTVVLSINMLIRENKF